MLHQGLGVTGICQTHSKEVTIVKGMDIGDTILPFPGLSQLSGNLSEGYLGT